MTATNDIHIAILLTCHNRQAKTTKCLYSLKTALVNHNKQSKEKIIIEIFLTDDGCTDGTVEAARNIFPNASTLHILHGNGNLYWAGGMRFCWKEAIKRNKEWNYYLLLNDDVELMNSVFSELLDAEQYEFSKYGIHGLVSGITCDTIDCSKTTYGGSKWVNKLLFTMTLLNPTGEPQPCDITNANILLVPTSIVSKIGIFHDKYQHSIADYDYSNTARINQLPVFVTANYCGRCAHDHNDYDTEADKIKAMSLSERKNYFNNPLHSNKDYMHFIRRIAPIRLPIVWIGRTLNVYFPNLYYTLKRIMKM